eukprot:363606-Chlamydomonas_euryale.AAC.3
MLLVALLLLLALLAPTRPPRQLAEIAAAAGQSAAARTARWSARGAAAALIAQSVYQDVASRGEAQRGDGVPGSRGTKWHREVGKRLSCRAGVFEMLMSPS